MVPATAIVMAGSRGVGDPVAIAGGETHKCLVQVAGKSMLSRVLDTLEASPSVGRIVLCIEASWPQTEDVKQRIERGRVTRLDAGPSPASSALRACERLADAMPLLIVTSDHPLMTVAMVEHFCHRASAQGDIAVGIARAELVLAEYPDATRTLLRFSDGARCGCNMFSINTSNAIAVVKFWTQLEHERKRPWRLIRMLGVFSLLRYLARRLSLQAAFDIVSRKHDARAQAIDMPFAEAAIDVDKPTDLVLVESILRSREG